MRSTGATDRSADVFLTGPAAISRTKDNDCIWGNVKHRKVSYEAFIILDSLSIH